MGTIRIKNLSTLQDKVALELVADYWCYGENIEVMKTLNVRIRKKGHTFTVLDGYEQKKTA